MVLPLVGISRANVLQPGQTHTSFSGWIIFKALKSLCGTTPVSAAPTIAGVWIDMLLPSAGIWIDMSGNHVDTLQTQIEYLIFWDLYWTSSCIEMRLPLAGVWMDMSGNKTNSFYSELEPYVDFSEGAVSPST